MNNNRPFLHHLDANAPTSQQLTLWPHAEGSNLLLVVGRPEPCAEDAREPTHGWVQLSLFDELEELGPAPSEPSALMAPVLLRRA